MSIKPQYPNWVVLLIDESTLPEILELTDSPSPKKFMEKLLNACREDIAELGDQCNVFPVGGNYTINDALTHVNPETNDRYLYFVVIDTYLRYPVGILNIVIKDSLMNALFEHNTLDVKALGCYISWTCSFTKSHKRVSAEKTSPTTIRDYYAAQAAYYQLTISKFVTDYVGEWLLHNLHETIDGTEEIKNVIFYSLGVEGARVAHRKHGKLNACTFIEQWVNHNGDNIPKVYDEPPFSNMMYYFYIQGGQQFIGSELYNMFIENGQDISQPKRSFWGGVPYGHKNFWKDTNFICPDGDINDNQVKAEYEARGGKSRKRVNGRKRKTRRNK
jgi:hypothetical protein